MAKSTKEIDKLFEKMSSECADKITGTYPRTKSKTKTVKKPKRK